MKFVCENCKAKYQIGDDKVAGKTVRMKCRRCGHLILVSSAVTESSAARNLAEGAPLGGGAAPGRPDVPAAPALDDDEGGSTVIMRAPPAPVRPAAPAPPAAPVPPAAPGRPAPPRAPAPPPPGPRASSPSLSGSVATRPSRPPPPRASVPATRPGGGPSGSGLAPQPVPSAPSLGDLAQRSMAGAISAAARGSSNPLGPGLAGSAGPAKAPSVAPPPSAGVAGAFQRAVAGTQPQLRADAPAEDWYVGVGGVPIGPVRLSVIREKVEQRAVDGESLVWREGFDEWQPLKNVPGLRAILDEGRRSVSGVDVSPRASISSSSLPRVTPPPGQLMAPEGLAPAPVPSSPGNTSANGSANGRGAATALAPLGAPSGVSGLSGTGGVSLGPAAPAAAPSAPEAGPSGPGAIGAEPLAVGRLAASAAATAAPLVAEVPAPAPPRPASVPPPAERKGMHPFAYAMIAMAAVFGGVAAWVLLTRQPAQVIVVQTAAPETGLGAAPPPPPTAEAEGPAEPAASATGKPGEVRVGGGARPAAPADTGKPAEGTAPPPNAGSFDTGVSGPTAGPSGPNAGSGKGQLSEGEISAVVSRNQPGVRRRCWQPALDAAASSAPKSARVNTSITIGPSGSVTSASASGSEQHYPGLSSCIGAAIRGWQFPPSDGTTTVNVPFSFVAQ